MNIIQEIQGSDLFTAQTLSAKLIEKEDYAPGQIMRMGLFEPEPIITTSVALEEVGGKFELVPAIPRDASPTPYVPEKATGRTFKVPHIPYETLVTSEFLQNLRKPGTMELETIQAELVRRGGRMARNIDGTTERLELGALRGIILNADNSVILNLFTEFGVSQDATYYFDLTAASPASGAVKRKANEVVRATQDDLGGKPYEVVMALCGRTFWDDFTSNKEVRESFKDYSRTADLAGVGGFLREGQVRKPPFLWGDIMWAEYRGGTANDIPADECIFFPVGVPDLYSIYYAPANFMEFANTLGMPRYEKQWPTDNSGRSITLHVQSNPLPLCKMPKLLKKGSRLVQP